jgi:rubrerythrin
MDVLEFAMEFEQKSYAFYVKMARELDLKELKTLFTALAEDEQNHMSVLKELMDKTQVTFESNHLAESEVAFTGIISSEFNSESLTRLKALKEAFAFEDESMRFYHRQSEQSENVSERLIFLRLYFEEKKHREIINDLIDFNTFIETSLETAEFQK